jgi:hypothetical protein
MIPPTALAVGCTLVLLTILGTLAVPTARRQVLLSFVPRPTPYAALYFTGAVSASRCPVGAITPGDFSRGAVNFTVENHQPQAQTFQYEVMVQSRGAPESIHRGSFLVAGNTSAQEHVGTSGPIPQGAAVSVTVDGGGRQLSVQCSPAESPTRKLARARPPGAHTPRDGHP